MILSAAANEKLQLMQIDVKTAFLYGELDEEIYMRQPDGFDDNSGRVCRVNKSLYGLKQALRCWNKKFTAFLRSFGLVASNADSCVFISRKEKKVIILAIYIDDGLLAVSDTSYAEEFIGRLCDEFRVTVQKLSYFLGLEIALHNDGSMYLHQKSYTHKILAKFGMAECNAVSVPMEPHSIVTSLDHPQDFKVAGNVPYRELVGSLMYLATNSRPGIAFAVSYVSQHMENSSMIHWNVLKRVLKYLKGT